MLHSLRFGSILVALCVVALTTHAADWTQWRGPNRADLSTETDLLETWPEGGPKQVWLNRNAGHGYSGVAVVDATLFTMGARDGKTYLLALDANSGKEKWATHISDVLGNGWGDGPRATPTADGERIYAMSGNGELICAKTSDGSVIWRCNMKDFGGSVPGWGYCESVLVDGDKVICTPGGKQGAILALNKTTGERIWQTEGFTDGAQYASIIVAEPHGIRQYIQLTMQHVVGVSTEGKVLWTSDWPGRTAVIPTPVYHDNHVYITSGYGVGCKLIRIDDKQQAHDVYDNKVMKNHHGGVLLFDGHIYGYSDGAGWVCQNFASGEMVWNEKSKLGKGAVSFADGKLILLNESDGQVVLIDASPKGWADRGQVKLEPQCEIRSRRGRIWTHPVISNGKMYLRDQDMIYCYDVAQ